jgi:hypothetical protein
MCSRQRSGIPPPNLDSRIEAAWRGIGLRRLPELDPRQHCNPEFVWSERHGFLGAAA